ncbi:MAG: hypothetical protein LPK47_05705 [Bacteroidota bacterium]|nr:hypothetical protein [Bacteroidota bacterium]
MKKLEIVLVVLMILSLGMKFMELPGSDFLLLMSATLLSLLYYLFGFALFNNIGGRQILQRSAYSKTNTKQIVLAIGLGIALSTLILGILFRFMMYPGGMIMLVVGLVATLLLALITLFFFQGNSNFRSTLIRALIFGTIGMVLFLLPGSVFVDLNY